VLQHILVGCMSCMAMQTMVMTARTRFPWVDVCMSQPISRSRGVYSSTADGPKECSHTHHVDALPLTRVRSAAFCDHQYERLASFDAADAADL
jgi:hypothetical protein